MARQCLIWKPCTPCYTFFRDGLYRGPSEMRPPDPDYQLLESVEGVSKEPCRVKTYWHRHYTNEQISTPDDRMLTPNHVTRVARGRSLKLNFSDRKKKSKRKKKLSGCRAVKEVSIVSALHVGWDEIDLAGQNRIAMGGRVPGGDDALDSACPDHSSSLSHRNRHRPLHRDLCQKK